MGILRRALYTKEATVGSPYGESFILSVYASKSFHRERLIVCMRVSASETPYTRLPRGTHGYRETYTKAGVKK